MIASLTALALSLALQDPPAPPSAEEIAQVAKTIGEAVTTGDGDAYSGLIDWTAFIERITAGIEAPAEVKNRYEVGVRKSGKTFCEQIFGTLGVLGSYCPVGKPGSGPEPTLCFRMITNDGMLNYHRYHLAKTRDRVRIVDIHVALTGETLTRTFRRFYLPVAAEATKGLLDRLMGVEQELLKHIFTIQKVQQLTQEGRQAEALKLFAGLPESLRKDKAIFMIRLMAAQGAGDADYEAALDDLQKLFPDDPSLSIHLIDALFMKKKFDLLRQALDRLDKELGGDSYLDVFRANSFTEEGKTDKARELLLKTLERDPALVQAPLGLLDLAARAKDHKEGVRMLALLRERHEVAIDPAAVEGYEALAASEEYKAWAKTLEGEEEKE